MSITIKAENISKAYQLGQIGTGTISRDLERWYASIRGKDDPFLQVGESNDQRTKSTSDFVWSLKDINFEIEQGDAVGIIGRNGAGKSTLLKILSKVTAPTTGKISGRGRIASLLEVGTGFHPELSGRENIFLNGAILGMRKHEIKRKLDEIVDFAGVERYLDTPVKRYSSGMYVRLAFAVAAHLESEILIVDEVLAVGDADFQKKCLGKMGDISKGEGKTVLFVSHNMMSINELCKSAILLANGNLIKNGSVSSVISHYQKSGLGQNKKFTNLSKSKSPYFQEVEINLLGQQPNYILIVNFSVDGDLSFKPAFFALDIKNSVGSPVLQAVPTLSNFIAFNGHTNEYAAEIQLNGLIPDTYYCSAWMGPHNTETYDFKEDIVSFEITISPTIGRTFPHHVGNGQIVAPSKLIEC